MLISIINLFPMNLSKIVSAKRQMMPPDKLYKSTDGLPENTAPSKILPIKIKKASFGVRYKSANRVIMLASPSFTPGIGIGTGICASITKIIRAMAQSMAHKVYLFILFFIKIFLSAYGVGYRALRISFYFDNEP